MADATLAVAIAMASFLSTPPVDIIPRADCDKMRGTPYLEPVWEIERAWFLENCVIIEPPKPAVAVRLVGATALPVIDGNVLQQFTQGFLDGGGRESLLPLVYCIIDKESGWFTYALNPAGPYYGLGQFLMSTWNNSGGGDWQDAYTQGRNFARNWNRSDPAGQWPAAYRLCA